MVTHSGLPARRFRNEILNALMPDDVEAILPDLTKVTLVPRQVLHARDEQIKDVFFIEDGVASLTADTVDDGQVEVASRAGRVLSDLSDPAEP